MKYKLYVSQKDGKKELFGKYKTIRALRKDFFAYKLKAKNIKIVPIKKKR